MSFEKIYQDWVPLEDIEDLADSFDIEEWIDTQDEYESLYRASLQLPIEMRNIVLFRYGFWDGNPMSYKKLAQVFKKNKKTIALIVEQGLEELKWIMDPVGMREKGIIKGQRMLLERIFAEPWDGVTC